MLKKHFNFDLIKSRKKKGNNTRFYAYTNLTFYKPGLNKFVSNFSYDSAEYDPWVNATFNYEDFDDLNVWPLAQVSFICQRSRLVLFAMLN